MARWKTPASRRDRTFFLALLNGVTDKNQGENSERLLFWVYKEAVFNGNKSRFHGVLPLLSCQESCCTIGISACQPSYITAHQSLLLLAGPPAFMLKGASFSGGAPLWLVLSYVQRRSSTRLMRRSEHAEARDGCWLWPQRRCSCAILSRVGSSGSLFLFF